jgi:uncharacterized repeat protein (TIGR02543 family)
VEKNAKAAKPADPTKADAAGFVNWYTSMDWTTVYDWDTPVTKNITLYARWKYTVTFNSRGGSEVVAMTADEGTAVSAPQNPTKEGAAGFDKWYTSYTNWTTEYNWDTPVTENITLYARWKYTITFNANGGTLNGPAQRMEKEGAVSLPTKTDITKEGHTFLGWYNAETEGDLYSGFLDASVIMYAHWRDASQPVPQYTITFNANGGTLTGPPTITADAGTPVLKPADPEKANCTFLGWFNAETGGAKYDWSHTLTGNVTMYAQWEPWVTITFNSTGGTAVTAITARVGTSVSVSPEPTKANFTFLGWYNETGGTKYTWPHILTGNVTMYAQWEPWVTLTFDSNGGSPVAPMLMPKNWPVNKPQNPTLGGWDFLGWFSALSGGTKYTWPHILAGDVTMYAHWAIAYDKTIEWTIAGFTDEADSLSDKLGLSLAKPSGSATIWIDLENRTIAPNDIIWYMGLVEIGRGQSIEVTAGNLTVGKHILRVTVKYQGILYSKEFAVTVT